MLKIVLSVVGVFVLTLGAWTIEGQVAGAQSQSVISKFMISVADIRQECEVDARDQNKSAGKLNDAAEKHAETYKHSTREPFPAERLGIMLRVPGV